MVSGTYLQGLHASLKIGKDFLVLFGFRTVTRKNVDRCWLFVILFRPNNAETQRRTFSYYHTY